MEVELPPPSTVFSSRYQPVVPMNTLYGTGAVFDFSHSDGISGVFSAGCGRVLPQHPDYDTYGRSFKWGEHLGNVFSELELFVAEQWGSE